MRILLVEDEPDIRMFLVAILQGLPLGVEVCEAVDGQAAIDLLEQDTGFDCILCDYNMPKKNGGEVFRWLAERGLENRFVLVSSDGVTQHAEFDGYAVRWIAKPNVFKPIVRLVSDLHATVIHFFEFRIELLQNMRLHQWDVYLEDLEDEYQKVITGGDSDFAAKLQGLRTAGNRVCYLTIKSAAEVFRYTHGQALASLRSDKATMSDQIAVTEVIHRSVQILGVTEEIQRLVKEAVHKAIERVKASRELRILIEGTEQGEYISAHSTLLAHVAGYLNGKLARPEESHYEIMAMAALLHDVTVESSEWAKVQSAAELNALKEKIPQDKFEQLKNHPIAAAEMSRMFIEQGYPDEVDEVIRRHHERPDGSGFPHGLGARLISFSAALFILSHEVTNLMVRGWKKIELHDIMAYLKGHYRGGSFDEIIEQLNAGRSGAAKASE